ncbi:MAG: hypothetical protein K9L88_07750 [Chromatiaceae bacterium]|nr:hypothetical protein [Chromatiaceae bacterium]
MSAAEILTHLQADGLHLHADGERLLAEPRNLITDDHRQLIRTHKPELLALLQAANEPDGTHQTDLDEPTEERAAIMEHDGGMTRTDATRIAKGAARDFYNHIMLQEQSRCGCRTRAWVTAPKFCPEGQRLRDAYHRAAEGRDAA